MLDFPDAARWESWLEAQHGVLPEAWLRIAKRHSGITSVTPAEATDLALCYGWIDGQRKSHDDESFLQRFSPRRPTSSWSKVNVAKAAVPPDLAAALAGNARANAAFELLGRSDRYAVILPLLKARTPQTRTRILDRAVARLTADD